MGYHVEYEGLELLELLARDPSQIFGRKYQLYILMLATSVDKEILEWLKHNEQAIDSLTREYVAFVTFYNSLRLVVRRREGRAFETDSLLRIEQPLEDSLPVLEVSSAMLREPSVIPYYFRQTQLDDAALVTSMTYESDSVARNLGISPAELPCFVAFDEPSSGEFYLINADPELRDPFLELRHLIGTFYSIKQNRPFFEHAEDLRRFEKTSERLAFEESLIQSRIERVEAGSPGQKDLPPVLSLDKLISFATYAKALLYLEQTLDEIFDQGVPQSIQVGLLDSFSKEIFDAAKKPEVTRIERSCRYFLSKVQGNEAMSELDWQNLERFYASRIGVDEGSSRPDRTLNDWAEILESLLKEEEDRVAELDARTMEFINTIDWANSQRDVAGAEVKFNERRAKQLESLESKLESVRGQKEVAILNASRARELFAKCGKPQIAPAADSIESLKKRSMTTSLLGKIASKADTVLKAVDLVLKTNG